MDELSFIDLCSGIGGVHKGLEEAGGYRCVYANDYDPHAAAVYRHRFPGVPFDGRDIRLVDAEAVPDHDVLCAGFPCQSFSTAGHGRGFEDTRGTVFFEVARIAAAKRPRALLLENVRGLLSNRGGETFKTILNTLDELGYHVEWQVLNSAGFGVPQSRLRVYIVGYLGERPPRTVFPVGDADGLDTAGAGEPEEQRLNCIDSNYWKGVDKHGQRTVVAVETAHKHDQHGDRVWDRVMPTLDTKRSLAVSILDTLNGREVDRIGALRTNTGSVGSTFAVSFTNPHNPEEDRQANLGESLRTLKPYQGNQQPFIVSPPHGWMPPQEKPYPNLRANRGASYNELLAGARYRRLMPLECERAQGFPDDWTRYGLYPSGAWVWTGETRPDRNGNLRPVMRRAREEGVYPLVDTHRYSLCGNAVTVNVIRFLGGRLAAALGAG